MSAWLIGMSSAPAPQSVCPICNYSLVGIDPGDDYQITCPECGTELEPASPDAGFTKTKFHQLFLYILVIPTLITSFAGFVGAFLPFEIGVLVLFLHLLLNPFILFALFIITSTTAFTRSKRYPRPYRRWSIPLWGLLYCLPGTIMYFFSIFVFNQWYG